MNSSSDIAIASCLERRQQVGGRRKKGERDRGKGRESEDVSKHLKRSGYETIDIGPSALPIISIISLYQHGLSSFYVHCRH